MRGEATRAAVLVFAIGAGLGACSTVGTASIEHGRTPYNEVIQDTSEQQTLLNLVRVHDGETPLFVDVTEVDALTSAQAGITGTPSMIGTVGTSGSIAVAGQYQEQPTVRYQPLLGAALVAQVSSPVTAEALVDLYDSGWPLGSIFDLAVTRFTPGVDDYHIALDALMTLDRYGALILEAKAPEKPMPTLAGGVVVGMGAPPKGDAALVIYFQPARLRDRFRPCDQGLPALHVRDKVPDEREVGIVARNLWARVGDLLGQHGDRIVLNLKSGSTPPKGASKGGPPTLRTRSALGMLKNAAEGQNLVLFDSRERVDEIIARTNAANHPRPSDDPTARCHASFYRVGDAADDGAYGNRPFTLFDGAASTPLDADRRHREIVFGDDRRLILVQVSAERPVDGFASVHHKGSWYSLRDDDLISKRNLALVSQIDTIEAVPPQSQPLTPAIVVGGR